MKEEFLSLTIRLVKVFLPIFALLGGAVMAKDLETHEFFLAKGEQVELPVKNLSSFSVGNKEVIRSKFYAAKQKVLVKGKSLGFSDLVIWNEGGVKTNFHFYVVSKKDQLTNFQLANDFRSLGLKVKAMAFELLVKGKLKGMEDLKLFNLYMEKNKDRVINMVKLSPSLQRSLIAGIYRNLGEKSRSLICSAVKTTIECLYEGFSPESSDARRTALRYSARFIPRSRNFENSNFKVELKVFRTDSGYLKKTGIGLEELSGRVGDVLNAQNGSEKLVTKNHIHFSEKNIFGNIATSPALLTSLDSPGEIQLGAEIPIVNQNQYGAQSTSWKFAGLKLITELTRKKGELSLSVKSELTHPTEGLIRGNKSKSSFFPSLGKYVQAFNVKYAIHSSGEKGLPGVSKIPLLGALFSSHTKNKSEQWLIGFVKVTRIK